MTPRLLHPTKPPTNQPTVPAPVTTKVSPINSGLYHFSKKVVNKKLHQQVSPIQDFRATMVQLHTLWYDIQATWTTFLNKVRKGGADDNRALAEDVAAELMDVAVAIFHTAVMCSAKPAGKQTSIADAGLAALITHGQCEECGEQGDIEAVLPGPLGARWSLRCSHCQHTWST